MPMYEFWCERCGKVERMLSIANRDVPQVCGVCGNDLKRVYGSPAVHGERWEMGAVLGDGRRVKGHFGKTAKLRRKGS